MSTTSQIAQFIRWRDWGPGKLTILWSLSLYIAVAYEKSFSSFGLTFLVFLIFAAAQSAMGYVLNDWGDRELDRRQFKYNAFNGKSNLECVLSLSLVAIMAFVTGLPLILRAGFAVLWLAWAASAASYSLEPLRLKTKGLVGLPVSFVAQWFLPVLITFSAFEAIGHLDMWLLAFALTISGATLEIGHQRWDRTRDMITRATTFAASLSDATVDRIYAVALLLDKLAIGLVALVAGIRLAAIPSPWTLALTILIGTLYLVLLLATLPGAIRSIRGAEIEDPYYANKRSFGTFLHETLLNFVVPVALGIAAMIQDPLYGILLGLFLVWRVILGGADWAWPLRAVRIRLQK